MEIIEDPYVIKKKKGKVYSNGAESTLSIFAGLILALGILIFIALIALGIYAIDNSYEVDTYIGVLIIVGAVLIAFFLCVIWASIKVMCNISNNVREINKKL